MTTVTLSGLQAGKTLVGIDVRPASPGTLYGVGSTSRIYTISPVTGAATQVGTRTFTTGLNGTALGLDFNPIPDRIREVSNTEQNQRLNPNDGTLTATDTSLNPSGNIVAVAYDRNYLRVTGDSTPTTLHGIDSAAGTLVTVGSVNGTPNSPNGGAITTVGSLGLGMNLNKAIGFDISGVGVSQANPVSGTAHATITTSGISRLYTINLATGQANLPGPIGGGTVPFLGVAAASAPEPGSVGLLGVAATFVLARRRRAAQHP